jgi:hypothetical protein
VSLQKIMPLAEADALIDLSALVLEERPVVLTPVPARRTLPNRMAVVGNYLPRHREIAMFTTDLTSITALPIQVSL